jgi:hypothetical protein
MIADEATYKDSLVNGTSVEQQVADAQFQASTASYEAAQQQTQLTQTQLDNIDTQIHGSYRKYKIQSCSRMVKRKRL